MIVLNELDCAYDAIKSQTLGNKPYETLCMIAKYYINKGYGNQQVRKELERFLFLCKPTASIPKWSDTLDRAIKWAQKHPAIEIDSIPITKKEMDVIDGLSGKQVKRLAFTLLCLAKYYDVISSKSDHWVNCDDSEIMKIANISTSIRRQSMMYHTLWKLGLLQFSKRVDNTNVRVLFIDDSENSDIVMNITDFRNVGYQYLMYCGEPFFKCERCGITTKIRNPACGRKQKYCQCCARDMYLQQTINAVMRNRQMA